MQEMLMELLVVVRELLLVVYVRDCARDLLTGERRIAVKGAERRESGDDLVRLVIKTDPLRIGPPRARVKVRARVKGEG